jgi:hypothetical protein
MSSNKLINVSIAQFKYFLTSVGCKFIRYNGGHEIWTRKDLTRPITFQTHIDPVPEFIIKNALRTLGMTRTQFWESFS